MTQPAQTLDEVLAAVTPLLAARGYRKSGRNFVALENGVARVVRVETSQLKNPDEASFTVHAQVASVAFHEAYAGAPFPRSAATAEPVVQAEVGRLTPEGDSIWWSLAPGVSPRLIAAELQKLLEELVLPFLSQFPSEAALLAGLESRTDLPGFSAMRERCRAVLLARQGRKDDAGQVLQRLLDANAAEGLEGFRESVHALARKLGLQGGKVP